MIATEHVAEWLETAKLNKLEHLTCVSASGKICNRPSHPSFRFELTHFEDFNQIGQKRGVYWKVKTMLIFENFSFLLKRKIKGIILQGGLVIRPCTKSP